MALAGDLGLDVDLTAVLAKDVPGEDCLLYSESAGRLIVSVPRERAAEFDTHLAGLPAAVVGEVNATGSLRVRGLSGKGLIDLPVDRLRQAWQKPLSF
jgi:phosphoribosylformylglycinamidine synthase